MIHEKYSFSTKDSKNKAKKCEISRKIKYEKVYFFCVRTTRKQEGLPSL